MAEDSSKTVRITVKKETEVELISYRPEELRRMMGRIYTDEVLEIMKRNCDPARLAVQQKMTDATREFNAIKRK